MKDGTKLRGPAVSVCARAEAGKRMEEHLSAVFIWVVVMYVHTMGMHIRTYVCD